MFVYLIKQCIIVLHRLNKISKIAQKNINIMNFAGNPLKKDKLELFRSCFLATSVYKSKSLSFAKELLIAKSKPILKYVHYKYF